VSPEKSGLQPFVVCLTRAGNIKWEYREKKDHFSEICKPFRGAPGSVRVFVWSDRFIDIDVKTGKVLDKGYCR
jgi:hypothetical protein